MKTFLYRAYINRRELCIDNFVKKKKEKVTANRRSVSTKIYFSTFRSVLRRLIKLTEDLSDHGYWDI